MAAIKDSIELNDLFSPIMRQVADSVSYTVTAMEQMQNAMNMPIDTDALKSARAASDRLNGTLDDLSKTAGNAENAMGGAGNAAKQADKAMKDAEEAAKGLGNEFGESANNCRKMSDGFANAADGINNLFMAFSGYKILDTVKNAFSAATSAAIEFESAVTGIYKTVEGTPQQLSHLSDLAKEMATEIPASVTEIAGVMESAGQLGIKTENIEDFSRVMIDLGNSTNLTSDAAASALAQFANVTKMDPSQYFNLGSSIVDLGNNFAATEADIVDMSTYLASAASLAGFSQSEILGLSTAMESMGINAEAGGSSMSRLITQMQLAVETGSGLEQFASVAGMSMQQFSNTFENDGVGALQSFITGLNDVERNGASTSAILQQMGLDDIRLSNTIKSLASNSGLLTSAVQTAGEAWSRNSALANEVNKRYATLESSLQMTKSSANNLKIAIGDSLNPTLGFLSDTSKKVLDDLTELAEKCPSVTAGVTAFTGSIGAAVGALGTAAPTIASVIMSVQSLDNMCNNAGRSLASIVEKAGFVGLGITAAVGVGAALMAHFSNVQKEVEDYNGTLEECNAEIRSTQTAYENVCKMYTESSEAAKNLEAQLETLNAQYEKGGGVVEDYTQRFAESEEAFASLRSEYDEKLSAIDDNWQNGMVAVAQLDALSRQANITNNDLDLMLDSANYLDDTFNCNIQVNYDTGELTGFDPNNLNGIMIEAAEQKRKQAAMDYVTGDKYTSKYIDYVKDREQAKLDLEQLEDKINANYKKVLSSPGYVREGDWEVDKNASNGWRSDEYDALKEKIAEAESEISNKNSEIITLYTQELGFSEEAAKSYIDHLQNTALSFDDVSQSAISAANEMTEAMTPHEMAATVWNDQIGAIEEFAAAYDEAYNSVRSSLDGMFGLFEKASMNFENTVSPDSALEAIQSQIDYFQQYDEAVNKLSGLGLDNNIISQLDPSQAVAFADALGQMDTSIAAQKIQEMNDKFEELTKVKDDAAETMAGVNDELDQKWEEIKQNMDTNFNNLTKDMDISSGAAQSARNVMDSYAQQLRESGGNAVAEAQNIADQIRSKLASAGGSISVNVSSSSPAVTTAAKGGGNLTTRTTAVSGYASGTTYAEDIFIAGEEGPELIIGKQGSTVFPNSETDRIIAAVAASDGRNYAAESSAVYNAANTCIVNNYNISQIIDFSVLDKIADRYRMQNTENYGDMFTENIYRNDYSRSQIEMVDLSGVDKRAALETVNMPESSKKDINITFGGGNPITVNSHENVSREEILEMMIEYAKPVFESIISDEIFEEGEQAYEY